MSIPGFTAEAAIYPVGKTHRTTDVSRTLKPGLEILPALIKPVSPDCHAWPAPVLATKLDDVVVSSNE